MVAGNKAINVATINSCADHGRAKDGFTGGVSSSISAQWVKSKRCRSACQPSWFGQRQRDSWMRSECSLRSTEFDDLILDQPAQFQVRLRGATDRKEPSSPFPARQQKQPTALERLDPACLRITSNPELYRRSRGEPRPKMVFDRGWGEGRRSKNRPVLVVAFHGFTLSESLLDTVQKLLLGDDHCRVRQCQRLTISPPRHHAPDDSRQAGKEIFATKNIQEKLLSHLAQHNRRQFWTP